MGFGPKRAVFGMHFNVVSEAERCSWMRDKVFPISAGSEAKEKNVVVAKV